MDPDVSEYCFGPFRLDAARRVLLAEGKPARLGARAVDVLLALVRRRERIVTKNELFDLVWPGLVVEENNLQVHISALRKLLGPEAIATIPGRGYQFVAHLADEPFESVPAARAPSAEPLVHAEGLPGNLPRATELFGRSDDVAAVCNLLREHPMVTIAGAAGIGKTALALAVARQSMPEFADGAWLVELAAANDSASAISLVARTLGVGEAGAPASVASLVAALRAQSMLLVLDNCEHVLEAVLQLVESLRRAAPKVSVLATSQENLRVAGEQVLRLAPLPVGEAAGGEAAHCGAVQLFVARAQSADRGFALDAKTLPDVVEICRRLDGLPLAIELAAARLPVLGVEGIRARLNERFRVLTGGARLAPRRHQTLHAAFQWSHDLLSVAEQTVFRRLGVFVGGFSLELAQRVAGDARIDEWAVLDHLGVLVDKSLVIAEGRERPRYRLLETGRAFALEQLDRAGETVELLGRHADALCQLLRDFDQAVASESRFDRLVDRIKPEIDNLHAALQWSEYSEVTAELAVELAARSDWLWNELELWREGWHHCERVKHWITEATPKPLAARFWLSAAGLGRTSMLSGATWVPWARRAAAGFRALDDTVGLYRSLCLLAAQTDGVVEHKEAWSLLEEAARIEDPQWAPRLRLRRQAALEWWHDIDGDQKAARDAGRRHVELAREAGGKAYIAALSNLADTELALGNTETAIALCREAIERAERIDRPSAAMNAYANIVPALLRSGRIDEAEAAIRSGRVACLRALGTAFVLLPHLAPLAGQRGAWQLAGQLLGCAERVYRDTARVMHPPERRASEGLRLELQAHLPAAEIELLEKQGAKWSEDEAFARIKLA